MKINLFRDTPTLNLHKKIQMWETFILSFRANLSTGIKQGYLSCDKNSGQTIHKTYLGFC